MKISNYIPDRPRRKLREWRLRGVRFSQGSFPYFKQQIYAPKRSVIFERIARGGVFEPETLDAMRTLPKPEFWVLDVGANIGVMSTALLELRQDLSIIAIECSPSTLPFLKKTYAQSAHKMRWKLVEAAVGKESGQLSFFTAGEANGAYDGFKDTRRGGPTREVQVQVKTLDEIWEENDFLNISLIKIDIEGGEFDAIAGAKKLISKCRPYILMEWNANNLAAYDRDVNDIFNVCDSDYDIYAMPMLVNVAPTLLPFAMSRTEMFLLSPNGRNCGRAGA